VGYSLCKVFSPAMILFLLLWLSSGLLFSGCGNSPDPKASSTQPVVVENYTKELPKDSADKSTDVIVIPTDPLKSPVSESMTELDQVTSEEPATAENRINSASRIQEMVEPQSPLTNEKKNNSDPTGRMTDRNTVDIPSATEVVSASPGNQLLHGGVVVPISGVNATLEFLLDQESGTLTAWVTLADLITPLRLPQTEIQIFVKTLPDAGGELSEPIELILDAVENASTSETRGDTAVFRGNASQLVGVDSFGATIVALIIEGHDLLAIDFSYSSHP